LTAQLLDHVSATIMHVVLLPTVVGLDVQLLPLAITD
jgi:hypothetical protein